MSEPSLQPQSPLYLHGTFQSIYNLDLDSFSLHRFLPKSTNRLQVSGLEPSHESWKTAKLFPVIPHFVWTHFCCLGAMMLTANWQGTRSQLSGTTHAVEQLRRQDHNGLLRTWYDSLISNEGSGWVWRAEGELLCNGSKPGQRACHAPTMSRQFLFRG